MSGAILHFTDPGFIVFLVIISLLFLTVIFLLLLAQTNRCKEPLYSEIGDPELHKPTGPILARAAFSVRPYRDETEDSEEEREETLHYFKEAVTRSQEEATLREALRDKTKGTDNPALFTEISEGNDTETTGVTDGGPSIVISNCAEGTEHAGGSEVPMETPFSINSSPVRSLDFLGKLMVSAQYNPESNRLEIGVTDGFDLAMPDSENCHSQVRVALLPERKQRFKTKVVPGTNPKYSESHTFPGVSQEKLSHSEARFRVYRPMGLGRRDQLIGEALLRLCLIDARARTCTYHLMDLSLTSETGAKVSPSASDFSVNSRRESMVDDQTGGFCSQPSGKAPELLVSLCFNDATGKLVIGIDKGSCLGVHAKNPDSMVKVTVLSPYGEEIGKSKTSIRKSNPSPVYSETFVFQVPTSELEYASVLIQVYCFLGVWRRKVLLGWLTMGQSSTSTLQEEHWRDMMSGFGVTVSKWHVLSEP